MQTPLWIKIIFWPLVLLDFVLRKSEERQSEQSHNGYMDKEYDIPPNQSIFLTDDEILNDEGLDIRNPEHVKIILEKRLQVEKTKQLEIDDLEMETKLLEGEEDRINKMLEEAERTLQRGSDKLNKRKGY